MALDLVCKMEVDEKTVRFKYEYKGTMHYFCSPLCKRTFHENPEKFIAKTPYQAIDSVCKMGMIWKLTEKALN